MIDLPARESRLRKALAEVQKDYDLSLIHIYRSIPNMMINNVLVVENKNAGATLSEIHRCV